MLFRSWMPLATSAQKGFLFFVSQNEPRDAAFILHQATERLYHCVLLVCTFYTPHNHNIGFLRTQAERLDRRLHGIWPMDIRRERAMFEKLKDAYVKARYSKHYRITEEELRWLGARVEELGKIVHEVCTERLSALQAKLQDAAE